MAPVYDSDGSDSINQFIFDIMKNYTAKIKFRFTFKSKHSDTMEVTHEGISNTSPEHAISLAWQILAKENFDRNLISKTEKIEIISIDLK